ncbi:MAG: LppP/LprE family lipoprotein, partial [Chloroflexi bacterium]|nr:LppP/LprE family lipoprotein [Chloroflexota bacterium]
MSRLWIAVLLVLTLSLPLVPPRTLASGNWLDGPLTRWNEAGMPMPSAPSHHDDASAPLSASTRAPETAEDEAVIAEGWHLHTPLQSGWGVKVIEGATGFDPLGQPIQHQAFVFVDGAFAGTLSPDLMLGGADGVLDRAIVVNGDTILAQFRRYTGAEPIDSPSGMTAVSFQIERSESGPVVTPLGAQTVARTSPPDALLSLPGPDVLMEIDEDEVRAGEKFTISIEARADDGVARIVWFATDTDDLELQQPHTADCAGAGVCRYSWPVVTGDTTGRIMIRAAASDVLGRASPAIAQELRVREASTAP